MSHITPYLVPIETRVKIVLEKSRSKCCVLYVKCEVNESCHRTHHLFFRVYIKLFIGRITQHWLKCILRTFITTNSSNLMRMRIVVVNIVWCLPVAQSTLLVHSLIHSFAGTMLPFFRTGVKQTITKIRNYKENNGIVRDRNVIE